MTNLAQNTKYVAHLSSQVYIVISFVESFSRNYNIRRNKN